MKDLVKTGPIACLIACAVFIGVLTFVIGFKSPDSNPGKVVINTILFFIFEFIVGFISYKVFKKVEERYPHTRRIPIAGLAYCLLKILYAQDSESVDEKRNNITLSLS